ncbi:SusC/RagA family TonB-linked outer membrane protein [Pseudopedobacter beijingensis]|uniref:SusC/RagA family TonB-linked outer membrane protein n=1 Tax=Pseudopedobacter beijingensis TaxID=1207056 RepID=A0ABW4II45_9SPHI
MKLSFIILMLAFLQVSASSFAQKVNIQVKDASINEVFYKLTQQTGHTFTADAALIKKLGRISLNLSNKTLKEVLERCFVGHDVQMVFNEKDKIVIIKSNISKAVAQPSANVTGRVTDENGEPLVGVSVGVKNQIAGVVTNTEGRYSIKVPSSNSILIFSYLGFATEERIVLNNREINVALKGKPKGLDEIVVIGYGTVQRGDLTGAISSISQKDLEKVPAATFDLKLQGRAAGVMVTSTSAEPGGNAAIRIRGGNSISGDNQPLYVIDGYPMPTITEASGTGYGQESNPLSGINPDDIESIEVLKDASATAIYGARGANGVVIVTTKRGREGATNISFDVLTGTSRIINLPEVGTAQQYAEFQNEWNQSRGVFPYYDGSSEYRPTPEQAGIGTRWLDEILRTGVNQKYNLSINGGNSQTRYNISGNYFEESGVVKNSKMTRGNLRINLDNNISKKFTLSTTASITSSANNRINPGAAAATIHGDAIYLALRANPVIPVDATGTGPWGGTTSGDSDGNFFENPLFLVTQKKDKTKNEDSFAQLKGDYKITQDLGFVANVGSTRRYSERDIYFPRPTALGFLYNSMAFVNKYTNINYVTEAYFRYSKVFANKYKLNAVAGTSYQLNESRAYSSRVSGFPDDILNTDGVQFATTLYTPSTSKVVRVIKSYYIRGNFDIASKYLFTFAGRADGSSVFAKNNKWGYFPSGAFAWKIVNEPFFSGLKRTVTDLKLRTSYGITGSQAIAPLGSLSRISSTNYASGETIISGTSITSVGNPDLTWEQSKQANIGLDVAFWRNRVRITADAYNKETDRLLQSFNIPASSGFLTTTVNMGSVRNRGLEFALAADLIDNRVAKWTSGFNISMNRSKVLELGGNSEIYGLAPATAASFIRNVPITIVQNGGTLPAYWGLVAERLIQESDFDENGKPTFAMYNNERRLGQWLYKDTNNDGIITAADRQILGDPNPKALFGFTNDFSYKKLSVSVFFQGVLGNDIMNLTKAYLSTGMPYLNKSADWFANRWTAENPTNDISYPALGTEMANLQPGNYYIEDGSYIRLKNVTLSYDFKINKSFIRNLTLSASATNLLTITNYSGFDPEVGIFGNSNLLPGIDLGSYPRSQTFQLGLKCNLK